MPLHHSQLLLAGPSWEPFSSPVKQHLLQEWGRHAWYDGCVLVEEGRLGASVLTSPNNRTQFCSFTRPECGLKYLTSYSPPSMFLVVADGSLRHWFIGNIHVFSSWPLYIYWNVDFFFHLNKWSEMSVTTVRLLQAFTFTVRLFLEPKAVFF